MDHSSYVILARVFVFQLDPWKWFTLFISFNLVSLLVFADFVIVTKYLLISLILRI